MARLRLVVDANVVIAEAMRVEGRDLLAVPSLKLFVASEAWSEAEHGIRKRIGLLSERHHLDPGLVDRLRRDVAAALAAHLQPIPHDAYSERVDEARWRIPSDPRDVPTVALALAFGCGIWTNDRDFFGCGVAVWSSEVMRHLLEETSRERQ